MTKRILHNILKPNGTFIINVTDEVKENTLNDWEKFFNKIGTIIFINEFKNKNVLIIVKQ